MTFAKILEGALSLFGALANIFREEKLMDAGEDRANAKMSREQLDKVSQANRARIDATSDDSVFIDPWDKANDGR